MITQSAAAGASPAHDRARYLAPTVTPSTSSTSTPPSSPPVTTAHYFAVTRAIRASARLTSTQRLVLLVIAGHLSNETGIAWPSIATIAAESGLRSRRTVEYTIAALVAAGWLVRDSAAGPWGTNVYRVVPRTDDARPRRSRQAPRGRPFAATPAPDAGPPPQSTAQATPAPDAVDLRLRDLLHESAVNAPPRGPHTHPDLEVDQEHGEHGEHEAPAAAAELVDVEPVVPEGPVEPAILDALAAHPELRALARPPVAALLAAEGRPLPVLRRALGELAEHARDAAAVGEPWSASTLIRKARAYVRRAYADPVTSSTSTPAPEPPPPPPRLDATVAELRAFRAALAAGPSTPPRRRR